MLNQTVFIGQEHAFWLPYLAGYGDSYCRTFGVYCVEQQALAAPGQVANPIMEVWKADHQFDLRKQNDY